jgi:hypothetical protein
VKIADLEDPETLEWSRQARQTQIDIGDLDGA